MAIGNGGSVALQDGAGVMLMIVCMLLRDDPSKIQPTVYVTPLQKEQMALCVLRRIGLRRSYHGVRVRDPITKVSIFFKFTEQRARIGASSTLKLESYSVERCIYIT